MAKNGSKPKSKTTTKTLTDQELEARKLEIRVENELTGNNAPFPKEDSSKAG